MEEKWQLHIPAVSLPLTLFRGKTHSYLHGYTVHQQYPTLHGYTVHQQYPTLHGYTVHQQYPTLYFPTDAHNVKKRRVIETF